MNKHITWIGEEHLSIEKCHIIEKEQSFHSRGEVVGNKNNQVYGLDYQIVVDEQWETRFFSINSYQGHKHYSVNAHKINNLWVIDDIERPEFNECLAIDIATTPYTNTLPINRLKLVIGESKELSVLYINPLEERIALVMQRYKRLSEDTYYYENLWNDFKATITVDEDGIVKDYSDMYKAI
ncbi:putative glycolipid-binding domain-containing protein [Myroides phaeus]|uniref:putative glycolipid-binding domain-containing protein n=1 Tax=Myroides phaeus TaxID=702745 RepID=UPI0013039204|nr:putative glycolipid-binding domain-containing protein [Myroides phaeus]